MKKRSATTGLIVEDLCVLQEMVGVLFDLERGTTMRDFGNSSSRVALRRTREASSMSEFVIAP